MEKRFTEEIFNQKRFGKLFCKWILACVLFSLQRSNIPAANHFPAFSVPKCTSYSTLPHQALLFYQQSPILTGQIIKPFTLKQNQSTKLPILTPLRVPRKDSASGAYWLEKYRGCLIWELECDFDIPGMNDLGVCVSNLTIHWSEQEKRINFSRIVFLKNPTRFYFSNQFYNSLNSQHSDSLQASPC